MVYDASVERLIRLKNFLFHIEKKFMLSQQLVLKTNQINDYPVSIIETKNVSLIHNKVGFIEKQIVFFLKNIEGLFIACRTVKNPVLIIKTVRKMKQLIYSLWGSSGQRIQKINGKYYFHLYAPAWPSKARRKMIRKEFLHLAHPHIYPDNKTFIFLAITRKCPLRCEHCFEWDNLNKKETFSKGELMQIIDLYLQQNILQIFFSGGEPMVRFRDLVELIRYAKNKTECFILTSGFNLSDENAKILKQSVFSVSQSPRFNNSLFNTGFRSIGSTISLSLFTSDSAFNPTTKPWICRGPKGTMTLMPG